LNLELSAIKAMILAAGEGTRLRPLTLKTPKLLLPVAGRPLIEHQLAWLRGHGIQEVAINLYHLGDKIKDFLGDGSRYGMKVWYSPEEALLGTAGGVKRMEHFFHETFVVLYGDVLTDLDLSAMVNFHQEKRAMATLAIFRAARPWEVGVVDIDREGRILSFEEKPRSLVPDPQSPTLSPQSPVLASGGVYVLQKKVLDHIPSQGFYDFAYDIFPRLIEFGLGVYGYVLSPEDYLLDIGTWDRYRRANSDVGEFKIPKSRSESELNGKTSAF
jgi:NDP-sugar pyrophosphorylase family protein